MKKAYIELASSTWTMTYIDHPNNHIFVYDFNNDDPESYFNRDALDTIQHIQFDDDKTLFAVMINNNWHSVINPQNIMSYKQPIGS